MLPEYEALIDEVRHSNRSPEEALYRAERALYCAPILFGEVTIGGDRSCPLVKLPAKLLPENPVPLRDRLITRFPDWAKRRGLTLTA